MVPTRHRSAWNRRRISASRSRPIMTPLPSRTPPGWRDSRGGLEELGAEGMNRTLDATFRRRTHRRCLVHLRHVLSAGPMHHPPHGGTAEPRHQRDQDHAHAFDVVEVENLRTLLGRDAHGSPPRDTTRSGRKSPSPTRRSGRWARPPTSYRTSGLSAGHSSSPNRPESDQQGRPSPAEAAETATCSGCPRHSAMPSSSVSSARGCCACNGSRALSRSPACGSSTNTFTSPGVTRTEPFHGLLMAILLGRDRRQALCCRRRGGLSRPILGFCRTVMRHFWIQEFGPPLLPVLTLSKGVFDPAPLCPLVDAPCAPNRLVAADATTFPGLGAVNLAPVAVATDAHLRPAPLAVVQSPRFFHHRAQRRAAFWTRAPRSAIGPRGTPSITAMVQKARAHTRAFALLGPPWSIHRRAPANCPPAPTTSQARPRRRLPALQKGPQLAGLLLSPLAPQGAAPAARLTAPRRYNDAVSIGEEIWGCPAVFTKFAR